ncbi:MAG: NAD-dependent epimerase/dehydratase family protein [Lentisphaerae bacterium]|nr:NAD-dependent epimerase/dehydratase family protein [Lentisphaerota bacterium]
MKVLITGGAGFIGSHLVESFQGQDDLSITVLDNLSTGHRENLGGFDCELIEASIEDPCALRDACRGVDYVFHLAAMVSVVESMDHPDRCVRTNVIGTLNVMKAAAEAGCRKLMFSSTCALYGEPSQLPITEASPPAPMSAYALSKLAGEHLLAMYADVWNLDFAVMRYFNVFGPRQDPASPYAAAIPIFITRALQGKDITIFGDGSQTRDFVSVTDVVRANRLMMQTGRGPYNVGQGTSVSIQAVAEQIVAATGSSSAIVHLPARAGEVQHSCSSIDRIADLGFAPQADLSSGLAATIAYFRSARRP